MKKVGRPPLLSGETLTEIESVLTNLRISGAAIAGKVIIAVRNGVLNARFPEEWLKMVVGQPYQPNGHGIFLNHLILVEQRETTAKKEINPALFEELTFSCKRKIAQIVLENNIHKNDIKLRPYSS